MVEARAALSRRRWAGDLSAADHRRLVATLVDDWDRLLRIDLDELLVKEASGVAERYRLRGYDAVHLASALAIAANAGETVVFGSWDHALDVAARRAGLRLLRASPPP
jgi:predicted nucleic acid-binding protein